MGYGLVSRSIFLFVLLSPLVACAAGFGPAPEGDVLRVRHDPARERTWYLVAGDGIYLHEGAGDALRRFRLPGWVNVVRPHASDPDLLVEEGGTVVVSSNIVPDLWRIDADSHAVARLRIAPEQDGTKEFGFTSLGFAADGAMHAIGSIDGAAWRIDAQAGRAERRGVQGARSAR